MIVSANGNGVHQRDQKGEEHSPAKGEAQHHQDPADATGECSEKSPPVQMRVKIEDPHDAAELRPTMIACEQDRAAN